MTTPDRVSGPIRILMTASEAYPAFEAAVLAAQSSIDAGFRLFDPRTRLRSDAARAVGRDWFDLIVHVLRRGVRVRLWLNDFDPIARPDMHRATWRTVRALIAAAEVAGPGADLKVYPVLHPARAGWLVRLTAFPMMRSKLRDLADRLNDRSAKKRADMLRVMPGLRGVMRHAPDGRVAPQLWPLPPLHPTTHHQKLAVIDGRSVYIGGLDLNDRRYDTPDHAREADETWQDLQLILEDADLAAEAIAHLEQFDAITRGKGRSTGDRLLRTLSRCESTGGAVCWPEPVRRDIAAAHRRLASGARDLIYLETQFFRDRPLARHLARLGRDRPGLGLIVMLPAAPDDVAFEDDPSLDARFGEDLQAKSLAILRDAFGDRLFVGSPAQRRAAHGSGGDDSLQGAPIIYIHSKVSLFDGKRAIVSSANLNGRSLNWDTETGIVLDDPAVVAGLRSKVMGHWLPDDAGPAFLEGPGAVAEWRALAEDNAARDPAQRRSFLLPHDLGRTRHRGVPVPFLPDELA